MASTSAGRARGLVVIAGAVGLAIAAGAAALAQRGYIPGAWADTRHANGTTHPYDGQFRLARLTYTVARGGYYYRNEPAWAHGYPRAEQNLMKIMEAITAFHPHVDDSEVVAIDDPELCKFPVAYMTEAGYWITNEKEAAAFRAYLLKGGFVIFDDFREGRGSGGWANLEENMQLVIPGSRWLPLTPDDKIFHSFFDINEFTSLRQSYDAARPEFLGLFLDNDRSQRLLAIANYNTDISDWWEFSGDGFMPVDATNEAYKFGVNYLVYGLLH